MRCKLSTATVRSLLLCFTVLWFCNCAVIRNSPKYGLANGYYTSTGIDSFSKKVYVVDKENTVQVYGVKQLRAGSIADTAAHQKLEFPETLTGKLPKAFKIRQPSFDLDVLTIPFKYRIQLKDFPRQLTTSLNGAVYFGYRTDVFSLSYGSDPLGQGSRNISHYGFSFGGFTGIGATTMNPSVTANGIGIEYDGVIWSKGVAGIIAVNSVTAGLAVGWDHLLDNNRKVWVYQNKLWLGLVFGLNLN